MGIGKCVVELTNEVLLMEVSVVDCDMDRNCFCLLLLLDGG